MSALLNCFHKRCLSLPRRKQERSRPVPIRAPRTERAEKFRGGKGKQDRKLEKREQRENWEVRTDGEKG